MYLKCFLHKKKDVFILILLFYVYECFPECMSVFHVCAWYLRLKEGAGNLNQVLYKSSKHS